MEYESGNSRIASANTPKKHPALPGKFPKLDVVSVEARSVHFSWFVSPLYEGFQFQITRAELDTLDFETVYEGEGPECEIGGLKPQTNYLFKLRFQSPPDQLSRIWSTDHTEISVTTPDESAVVKASHNFMRAVVDNEPGKVKSILEEFGKQISLEARDKNGRTLLMVSFFLIQIAAQHDSVDIIKQLLNGGADPHASTLIGKTALSIAVAYGNKAAVDTLLLFDKTLLDCTDTNGSTLLMWAAESAPQAARKGSASDIIKVLLSYNVDVNKEDLRGYTALDRLCMTSGSAEAAVTLIKAGARIIHHCDKKHTLTSLMTAAMNGHTDLCKELIENFGADRTVKSEGFINGQFSDLTVRAFDEKFKLHRIILITNQYFKDMLLGDWKEFNDNELELYFDDHYITSETFSVILERIYGNLQTAISEPNVLSLLATAFFFQDELLIHECCQFILKSINDGNLVRYLEFADSRCFGTCSDDIVNACLVFLCRTGTTHFYESIWQELDLKYVELVLALDCFYTLGEYDRFMFIQRVLECRHDLASLHLSDTNSDCDESTLTSRQYSFESCVLFVNMDFEELLLVEESGKVPLGKVEKEAYRNRKLKHLISKLSLDNINLALHDRTETPVKDTLHIDIQKPVKITELLYSPDYLSTAHFRFSFEYDVKAIQKGGKHVSTPTYYFGSSWQNTVQLKNSKLCIYLQRVASSPWSGDDDSALIDCRKSIRAWFQLFCFVGTKCFQLESKPDEFQVNQSWGWTSLQLGNELTGDKLQLVTVIGFT
ncbi:hypothetical protein HDV01_006932 [Terramyces sp. JEL0728]|nr:hypothetical protein HDV01_006932 [Terramyces sp. JEL0728]